MLAHERVAFVSRPPGVNGRAVTHQGFSATSATSVTCIPSRITARTASSRYSIFVSSTSPDHHLPVMNREPGERWVKLQPNTRQASAEHVSGIIRRRNVVDQPEIYRAVWGRQGSNLRPRDYESWSESCALLQDVAKCRISAGASGDRAWQCDTARRGPTACIAVVGTQQYLDPPS